MASHIRKRKSKADATSAGKSRSRAEVETVEATCPHCQDGPEFYRMLYNFYKFDVDMARAIVNDGRKAFELEPKDVKHALDWCRIHPQHLAHVDVRFPGIIAHYWYPEQDGTVLQGHVLIDGHHRAARTIELGIPFYVNVLSEEESKQVTVRNPSKEQFLAKHLELLKER